MVNREYSLSCKTVKSVIYHRQSHQSYSQVPMPTVLMMLKISETQTSFLLINACQGPPKVETSTIRFGLRVEFQMDHYQHPSLDFVVMIKRVLMTKLNMASNKPIS